MLVDTNVIIEAHRARVWQSLLGRHRVESVEACILEIRTGFQRRRPEMAIDENALRNRLGGVHAVSDRELLELRSRISDISLDAGEESLWAHALGRTDAWVLCGPDKASLRCGVRLGFRCRLVSLEELLAKTDPHGRRLRDQYTMRWHAAALARLVRAEKGTR